MLIAVNYHYIRESFETPYPSIFGVTPQQFADQLDVLGQTTTFLGADDISEIIKGEKEIPPRAVIVTFDDGLKEQYDLAWPILQQKGIPAIFFVNTKPIEEDFVTITHKIHIIRAYTHPSDVTQTLQKVLDEAGVKLALPDAAKAQAVYRYDKPADAQLKYFLNYVLDEKQQHDIVDRCFNDFGFANSTACQNLYMTKDMIVKLAMKGCLGSHGHAHRPLGILDDEAAIADFDVSMHKIKEWTGRKTQAFSYPFGFKKACSQVVANHALAGGYVKFAFTMERAGNAVLDAPMFMARFSTSDIFTSNNVTNPEEFWTTLKHARWFREYSFRS